MQQDMYQPLDNTTVLPEVLSRHRGDEAFPYARRCRAR
jgi:hypothetical protein